MPKSKFVIDKLAKLFEQGLISYKDLSSELLNILKSKRDEMIFKMKLTSKEETEVMNKRIEKLEQRIKKLEKRKYKKKVSAKKNQKGKKILVLNPFAGDVSKLIFPP